MKIYIKEPFWSAWKKFGWDKGIPGVGLDVNTVQQAVNRKEDLEISLYTYPETFIISGELVQSICESNHYIHHAKNNTTLYIIPKNILKIK